MKNIIYYIVKFFGSIIYYLLYMPKISGRQNIPKKGGVILAGNHIKTLDAATLIAVPRRKMYILSKAELFEKKFGNFFFKSMGCIRVDRKNHEDNVKEEVETLLKKGKVVVIFPEGTTNKTKDIIMPFKYGAVSFAKNNNVPIVPFAISGKYKKFKRGIKIEFAQPIYIKDDIEKENNRLMEIVKNMIIKGKEKINEKRK